MKIEHHEYSAFDPVIYCKNINEYTIRLPHPPTQQLKFIMEKHSRIKCQIIAISTYMRIWKNQTESNLVSGYSDIIKPLK